jgi:hypothetical protein
MVARKPGSAPQRKSLVTKRPTVGRNVLTLGWPGVELPLALGELFEVLEQLRRARLLARFQRRGADSVP